jgi:X-Pro dipeptidyl-peptidase
VTRTSEGVGNVPGSPRDCWGESSEHDSACYIITRTNTTTATQWRVSKGIVDALNIFDRTAPTPLRPTRFNAFVFDLLPHDYVFSAGSRIAAVVVGSYPGYSIIADTNAAGITVDLSKSALILPVVGGMRAAADAGIPRTGG